jgi:hypothetical protein
MQRGDERPPLRLLVALGEQLLELVHHQYQPPLPPLLPPGRQRRGRPAWPGHRGLPGGQREPLRVRRQFPRQRGGVGAGVRGHLQGQFIQRGASRGEHQLRPPRRCRLPGQPGRPQPRQHPRGQQRRLART